MKQVDAIRQDCAANPPSRSGKLKLLYRSGVETPRRVLRVGCMVDQPYGFWTSPITSDLVVADAIQFDQIAVDGQDLYWSEGDPKRQGRTFVYRLDGAGQPEPALPDDDDSLNIRTLVHEYGGGAFVVRDGVVWFSNFSDQRIYVRVPGQAPRPITDAAPNRALRYADADVDLARNRLVCVREDHTGPTQAANTLVAVDLAGAHAPVVLVSGNDFYAAPRLSPDGGQLAWLTWNHPHMPWVTTELWVADVTAEGAVGNARLVAGGSDEALFQPQWSPDGVLYFVSDRGSGWWNLHRGRDGAIERVFAAEAEFGVPQWQFNLSTYAFESAERIICTFVSDGVWRLALVDTRDGRVSPIETPFTEISQLRARSGRAVFFGGAPTEPRSLVTLDLATGTHRVLRRAVPVPDAIRPYLSAPEAIDFPTEGGARAHALFYPPHHPQSRAPEGEKAPVLVKCHGGPTGSASSTLSLSIQYWTSRGIGVLDVNYRGSTGYGRDYRLQLERCWGLADVDDCTFGARFLVEHRNADPERLAISGGSAGGYTVLRALTQAGERTFKAGASYYGVSDLAVLARDTHKFESHYLDWLIGPYPQDAATYAERSPINHIDRLTVPVIFFQGAEDAVVPPNQTQLMVDGLKRRGVPVGYLLFDGEQHGFRRAENIKRSLDAELYFYAALLFHSGLHYA